MSATERAWRADAATFVQGRGARPERPLDIQAILRTQPAPDRRRPQADVVASSLFASGRGLDHEWERMGTNERSDAGNEGATERAWRPDAATSSLCAKGRVLDHEWARIGTNERADCGRRMAHWNGTGDPFYVSVCARRRVLDHEWERIGTNERADADEGWRNGTGLETRSTFLFARDDEFWTTNGHELARMRGLIAGNEGAMERAWRPVLLSTHPNRPLYSSYPNSRTLPISPSSPRIAIEGRGTPLKVVVFTMV